MFVVSSDPWLFLSSVNLFAFILCVLKMAASRSVCSTIGLCNCLCMLCTIFSLPTRWLISDTTFGVRAPLWFGLFSLEWFTEFWIPLWLGIVWVSYFPWPSSIFPCPPLHRTKKVNLRPACHLWDCPFTMSCNFSSNLAHVMKVLSCVFIHSLTFIVSTLWTVAYEDELWWPITHQKITLYSKIKKKKQSLHICPK